MTDQSPTKTKAPPPPKEEPSPYTNMDEIPRVFNSPLILFDGKHEHECVLRQTRRFDTHRIRWLDTEFWAFNNTGGKKIDFEPKGWRKFK